MINKILLVNCSKENSLLNYLRNNGYSVEFCSTDNLVKVCLTTLPEIILILDLQGSEELVSILNSPSIQHIPAIHAVTEKKGHCSDCVVKAILKQVTIYKSLINMKIISDKITNIIEKQVDMQNAI